ncbi:hypothetical protein [Coleofasciculus sp. FACHB-501]|uniref:hypothetical protein n=1 Tax=Coleofasciculus sp. FACHB-501 TaxID=2692786 RepID=UPI001A7E203F|nr:hypothetical protein [Coleofasciculus sp. FACHB-501]
MNFKQKRDRFSTIAVATQMRSLPEDLYTVLIANSQVNDRYPFCRFRPVAF